MPLHIKIMRLTMQYWTRIHQLPYSPICDTLRQSRLLPQSKGYLVQQYKLDLQLTDFTVSHMPNSDEPIWKLKSNSLQSWTLLKIINNSNFNTFPITVKRIIAKCPSLRQVRRCFPTVDINDPNHDNIMKNILSEDRNFNIARVIEFLDGCDMLGKI